MHSIQIFNFVFHFKKVNFYDIILDSIAKYFKFWLSSSSFSVTAVCTKHLHVSLKHEKYSVCGTFISQQLSLNRFSSLYFPITLSLLWYIIEFRKKKKQCFEVALSLGWAGCRAVAVVWYILFNKNISAGTFP